MIIALQAPSEKKPTLTSSTKEELQEEYKRLIKRYMTKKGQTVWDLEKGPEMGALTDAEAGIATGESGSGLKRKRVRFAEPLSNKRVTV